MPDMFALIAEPAMSLLAAVLFLYWALRVVSLLLDSEGERNKVLDRDLDLAFQIWLYVRTLFFPRPFLLP
jgi:hypothetical protein